MRNLIADGRAQIWTRRRALMVKAFPEAMVEGYQPLVAAMSNHPKDRHVAAAAARAGVRAIVTSNLRDFEPLPDGIEAWSPDDFLGDLFADQAPAVVDTLVRQVAALHAPPTTLAAMLERLERSAPTFAVSVRQYLAESDPQAAGRDSS